MPSKVYIVEYKTMKHRIPIKNEYNTVGELAREIKHRFKISSDIPVRLMYMEAILHEYDSLYDLQLNTRISPIKVSVPKIKPNRLYEPARPDTPTQWKIIPEETWGDSIIDHDANVSSENTADDDNPITFVRDQNSQQTDSGSKNSEKILIECKPVLHKRFELPRKSFRTSREMMQYRKRSGTAVDLIGGLIYSSPIKDQQEKLYTIKFESLRSDYTLDVFSQITVQRMADILWTKIEKEERVYNRQSHSLFLYNHRTHIFPDVYSELVSDIVALTPYQATTHFYFYILKNTSMLSPYEIDNTFNNAFENMAWWNKTDLFDVPQCPRSLSILLMSMHTLRSILDDKQDSDWPITQNQFLNELSKYMFLPGIIAFKHALDGWIYLFEKPLLLDSCLRVLDYFCPDKVPRHQLCDHIPLFFCWLLDRIKCNANQNVELFHQAWVHDTAFPKQPSHLHQFKRNHSEYLFYNYSASNSALQLRIPRLDIQQAYVLYESMAENYSRFAVIVTGAMHTNENDELQLFECFESIYFFTNDSSEKPRTSKHLCTDDLFDKVNVLLAEPSDTIKNDIEPSMATDRPKQIIMVLFDCSRSMFEKRAGSDGRFNPSTKDLSKQLLISMKQNINLINNDAIGLTYFGEEFHHVCPISSDLKDFEAAVDSSEIYPESYTKMYEAILRAIEDINKFERESKSKSQAQADCRKRIICVSDGINNCGTATLDGIKKGIEKSNVILDFMCFLPDDQYDQNKLEEVRKFREICIKSGGQARRNITNSFLNNERLFAQEAAKILAGGLNEVS